MKLSALFMMISMSAAAAGCAKAEAGTEGASLAVAEKATPEADISVSGCLERNAEGAFVVTRISAVSRRTNLTGESPAATDRQPTPNAFQIGPDGSQVLESVIGQWVNVSGSLRGETRIDASVVSVLGESCGRPATSANGGHL